MENNNQRKVVRKVLKQPVEKEKTSNVSALKNISYVILFLMVFVIFVRGFNVKSTVNEQNQLTREEIKTLVIEQLKQHQEAEDINHKILKDEILSAYALYSRLSATELKEKEDYHKQQLDKWEKIAKSQVTKNDINNIHKEIQSLKDTTKNDGKKSR